VPFREVDVDADEGAGRLAESLNAGNRSTPTILFGGTEDALVEPSLDVVDARLLDEGWPVHRPEPGPFTGSVIASALPLQTVVGADGAPFRLSQFRGRRQLAVFFVHGDAYCMSCAGYARQLAAVGEKLAEADARALVVVQGGPEAAAAWLAHATDKIPVVADHGGAWKASVEAHLGLTGDVPGALMLGLDRFLAPRIGSSSADVGGLATPLQVAEWLEFASFECAECATPVGSGEGD